MKEVIEKLAAVLTVEEVQGLLEGTHHVAKSHPKRAKTADQIGNFLRFNKPNLIVHRGWAEAIDERTFKVTSNQGEIIQPVAVNRTYFNAEKAPHLFLGRAGVPTWNAPVIAEGGSIYAPGVESRIDLRKAVFDSPTDE